MYIYIKRKKDALASYFQQCYGSLKTCILYLIISLIVFKGFDYFGTKKLDFFLYESAVE